MRSFALIFLLFLFFSTAQISFAAEVVLSSTPSSIQKDQEITVDVAVTGAASNTTNYVRIAFFHPDSPTSYFGYVYNHASAWYNGTPSPIDAKQFLEVQINNDGNWSGQIKIKVDTDSPYFKGNGVYSLKAGRYTASASSISNWSTPAQIEIQGVAPTPTLTSKPTPTEKPPPTSKPIKTPTPQKTITTVAVSPQITDDTYEKEDTNEEIQVEENENLELSILGESTSLPTLKVSPTGSVKVAASSNTSSLFFISGAVILVIGCGILLVRAYRQQKLEEL